MFGFTVTDLFITSFTAGIRYEGCWASVGLCRRLVTNLTGQGQCCFDILSSQI